MATKFLEQISGRFLGWRYKLAAIAQDTTTDPVEIPNLIAGQRVAVRLQAQTNEAKIQFTISQKSEVDAGTAVWEDWPLGANIGTVSDQLSGPVTALRAITGTASADTTTFEILI